MTVLVIFYNTSEVSFTSSFPFSMLHAKIAAVLLKPLNLNIYVENIVDFLG